MYEGGIGIDKTASLIQLKIRVGLRKIRYLISFVDMKDTLYDYVKHTIQIRADH